MRLDFIHHVTESKAEYFQDLWVLKETGFKRQGFFIEFGATNGVDASNTWLLESNFDWRGILVEPNPQYQKSLANNRKCHIDGRIVWNETGKTLNFLAMEQPYTSVVEDDYQHKYREELRNVNQFPLETVSLNDILKQYGAPKKIDFLSIDVEGSEERILRSFFQEKDFQIDLMCVEHNWRDKDGALLKFVISQGYERVHAEFSERDYWFRRVL
jgi:FkbM family methyltransferase